MPLHPQCAAFLDQIAAAGGTSAARTDPGRGAGEAMPPELGGPEQPVHSGGGSACPRRRRPDSGARLPAVGGAAAAGADLLSRRRLRAGRARHERPPVPCAGQRQRLRGDFGGLPAGARAPVPGRRRRRVRGHLVRGRATPPTSAWTRRASPWAATAPAATSPPWWRCGPATAADRRWPFSCSCIRWVDFTDESPSMREYAERPLPDHRGHGLVRRPLSAAADRSAPAVGVAPARQPRRAAAGVRADRRVRPAAGPGRAFAQRLQQAGVSTAS